MKIISVVLVLPSVVAAGLIPYLELAKRQPESVEYNRRVIDTTPAGFLEKRGVDTVVSTHVPLRTRTIPGPRLSRRQTSLRPLLGSIGIDGNGTAASNSTRLRFRRAVQLTGSVTVGKQDFDVLIDTGSSDTWIMKEGYTCLSQFVDCGWEKTFKGNFQYGEVPGLQDFSITYGIGNVDGRYGYEDITVAGVTVKKQQIALGNKTSWMTDGSFSGILGLSYPSRTHAWDVTDKRSKYDPVFTSISKQNLTTPVFSISMDRDTETGFLALGGLPPVQYDPDFGRTPIMKINESYMPESLVEHTSYAIVADDYILGTSNASKLDVPSDNPWANLANRTSPSQFPIVVDSGSSLTYLPTAVFMEYALQFGSNVVIDHADNALYKAFCNTTMPPLGVVIGGKTFYMSPADLLFQASAERVELRGRKAVICIMGVQNAGRSANILGDTFMASVVSVFDVGNEEMRFYKRK